MHAFHDGYRGLALLVNLNIDRLLFLALLVACLLSAIWLGAVFLPAG